MEAPEAKATLVRLGEVVERSPLFAGIDREEALSAIAGAKSVALAARAVLFTPGAVAGHLHLVVAGELVGSRDAAGRERVARFVPGDCMGGPALFALNLPPVFVFAETDAQLLAFDREATWNLIGAFPKVAANLLRIQSWRTRAAV